MYEWQRTASHTVQASYTSYRRPLPCGWTSSLCFEPVATLCLSDSRSTTPMRQPEGFSCHRQVPHPQWMGGAFPFTTTFPLGPSPRQGTREGAWGKVCTKRLRGGEVWTWSLGRSRRALEDHVGAKPSEGEGRRVRCARVRQSCQLPLYGNLGAKGDGHSLVGSFRALPCALRIVELPSPRSCC